MDTTERHHIISIMITGLLIKCIERNVLMTTTAIDIQIELVNYNIMLSPAFEDNAKNMKKLQRKMRQSGLCRVEIISGTTISADMYSELISHIDAIDDIITKLNNLDKNVFEKEIQATRDNIAMIGSHSCEEARNKFDKYLESLYRTRLKYRCTCDSFRYKLLYSERYCRVLKNFSLALGNETESEFEDNDSTESEFEAVML